MDFFELKLTEKVAKVLEQLLLTRKYNRYELVERWLASKTYDLTIHFDVGLASQARTHIMRTFEKELGNNLPRVDEASEEQLKYYAETVYWMGYVTAYWFFMDGTTGTDILNTIDIRKTVNEVDVLHTLSVKTAIRKIKEDNRL